jgi:DNA end-binding protein Ku
MAARPIWKGHLRLSLVTVPVRVYPATNAAGDIHFNQLHRDCMSRIQYKKWCPVHEREVTKDEIVKGYEFQRGKYVALEEEEIAKVRPESTRIVNLRQVTDAAEVDSLLLDTPYFVAPDGAAAAESFAVLREALKGKAAIGTVAFHGRERLVALQPRGAGLVMHTLRHDEDVRDIDAIPELDDLPAKLKPEEISLARKVIGGFEAPLDLAAYTDSYEEALRSMIKAKVEGEEIVETDIEEPPKVVNLMEALRKSLDQVSAQKKRPARAAKASRKKTARTGKVTKFARRRAS